MRRQVMMQAAVEEVKAPRAMLESAQAVFLTSSLIGLRRVTRIDGVGLGDHPLLARLTEALAGIS